MSGSPEYDKFLACLGETVELLNFKGYSGGLDTKNEKTGKTTIYTKWKDFEVVYHCATMLPFSPDDEQQIQRKRHMGNGNIR